MDAPPVAQALVWRAAGLVFEWPAGLPIAVYRQGCRDPFAEVDAAGKPYMPLVLQAIASRWPRDAGW